MRRRFPRIVAEDGNSVRIVHRPVNDIARPTAPKLIGCVVCGKMVDASAGASPIIGKTGWHYITGGSLVCSNECHEEIDPGIPVKE